MGQMMTYVKEMKATGDSTFTYVERADRTGRLGARQTIVNVPFIMPARVAATPPGEQITGALVPALTCSERRVGNRDGPPREFEKYVPRLSQATV